MPLQPAKMKDFPLLYTARLKLRKIQVEDIPSLVNHANNKNISDHILNMPYPYQEPDAVFRISYVHQGFKTNTRYVFAIALNSNDEFIGEISLHIDQEKNIAELGYWIGELFWNKGFATEAIAAVLKFGFEKLNLDIIFATCHADNIGSSKVLEKNKLIRNGAAGNIIQYSMKRQIEVH